MDTTTKETKTPEQAIEKRIDKNQELLLVQLKKTPIVQVVCEKVGVGRTTYYRWRRDDPEFAKLADQAIEEGASLVNDMAESQLMGAIRDGNMTAIIFWLKHHHPQYSTKVEVTAHLKTQDEKLTPEQETLVTKALKLAALIPDTVSNDGGNKGET